MYAHLQVTDKDKIVNAQLVNELLELTSLVRRQLVRVEHSELLLCQACRQGNF